MVVVVVVVVAVISRDAILEWHMPSSWSVWM